jgi:hypothetical protein
MFLRLQPGMELEQHLLAPGKERVARVGKVPEREGTGDLDRGRLHRRSCRFALVRLVLVCVLHQQAQVSGWFVKELAE